jgi:hypothetical protein
MLIIKAVNIVGECDEEQDDRILVDEYLRELVKELKANAIARTKGKDFTIKEETRRMRVSSNV